MDEGPLIAPSAQNKHQCAEDIRSVGTSTVPAAENTSSRQKGASRQVTKSAAPASERSRSSTLGRRKQRQPKVVAAAFGLPSSPSWYLVCRVLHAAEQLDYLGTTTMVPRSADTESSWTISELPRQFLGRHTHTHTPLPPRKRRRGRCRPMQQHHTADSQRGRLFRSSASWVPCRNPCVRGCCSPRPW